MGVERMVYHRGWDEQTANRQWGEDDRTTIRQLIDMGFKVTVTGGITTEAAPFFQTSPCRSSSAAAASARRQIHGRRRRVPGRRCTACGAAVEQWRPVTRRQSGGRRPASAEQAAKAVR